jgi:hypothetical protein
MKSGWKRQLIVGSSFSCATIVQRGMFDGKQEKQEESEDHRSWPDIEGKNNKKGETIEQS